MRDPLLKKALRSVLAAALVITVAGACRPKPPETPPSPDPPPPAVDVPAAAPAAAVAAADAPAPTAVAASLSPAAPSAVIQGAKSKQPALSSMRLALPSAKLGAPVDLHYQFDGAVDSARPATLYLAAVPRISGGNMTMRVVEEPLLQVSAAALNAQKASAATAYRQQVSVNRLAGGPDGVKVLVTLELPEGLTFTHFTVPFSARALTAKEQTSTVQ